MENRIPHVPELGRINGMSPKVIYWNGSLKPSWNATILNTKELIYLGTVYLSLDATEGGIEGLVVYLGRCHGE